MSDTKGCGECGAPAGGPCRRCSGYCHAKAPIPDACDIACPHRVHDPDIDGSSPYHCRHPELVEVRLASGYRPKPGWCPTREGGPLFELSRCVSCGELFDPEEAKKWPDVCRLCAHLTEARQNPAAFVFERKGRRFLYTIGKEPPNAWERRRLSEAGALGFGGACHVIRFLSDNRRIVSHNCWTAGEIPRALFDVFPTTAEIEEVR